jgi:hypothetical protein
MSSFSCLSYYTEKKNARLGDKRRIADNETPLVETHGFAA